ncbi:hypothetical protein BJX66DRAFT_344719 [Aspergillus keveii]|uniref:Carboxylic ester hydrolase n=1 Tax=Aspergillus keveii TaxID=714993 RepID=A0ABR4FKA3_9EURO
MIEDGSNQKSVSVGPAQVSEVGSEPHNAPATEYKRHPVYSPSEWLLEFVSSILALGLLIGIAIIFWYMDNKPLSAWSGRVSLNATISILTTACATALMHGVSAFISQFKWIYFRDRPRKLADFEVFDGASRGLWGATLLLTTVKWNLATIGAFITILRLSFSPFTQQVVLIEQRDIISPADNATFGYAHNYTRDLTSDIVGSGVGGIPQDSDMQSAIYRGLYGISTPERFRCPGTCRWTESYISIGFRTECRNVTQEALQTMTCEGVTSGLQECNMTTPGGLSLGTRYAFTAQGTAFNMSASSLLNQTALPDQAMEITRFAIYRSSPDINLVMRNINITDCSLFLTVYEYSGARADGSNFTFANQREIDLGARNPWFFGYSAASNMHAPIHTNATTVNGTHVPALEIGYANLLALGNFFESMALTSPWVQGSFDNRFIGIAAALMGDTNLDSRFDDMATAMTEALRYGPNSMLARGETIQSEPYVSIRWGYFVVPVVTEGLSILFAILAVFSNRKSRRVPLWKSSTLAVLACQHEERLGLLQTTARDVNEIQADAAKAAVRLQ